MSAKKEAKPKKLTKRQAEKELRLRTERVTELDLERVLKESEEIKKRFRKNPALKRFAGDVRDSFKMVRDYYRGRYRAVPYWTIAAIVAALIYVVSPVDLLPDTVPVVGHLDDAAVMAACVALVRADLDAYRVWSANFEAETEEG